MVAWHCCTVPNGGKAHLGGSMWQRRPVHLMVAEKERKEKEQERLGSNIPFRGMSPVT